jgi:hypothetical protein
MFRSRFIFDRRFRKRNDNVDNSNHHENTTQTKDTNKNSSSRVRTIDGNNNNSRRDNNFDFIEPCDIVDELNNEIDSLDSLEVKNWRYHLTNNKF